ncbi:hypothetical protein [Streptomyces nigrescens]|uniref:Uncharacterized protein n=1 Tax=Streptomyces nigrescens TaxID=1920 RepID=A0ABY7IYJ9_STRNI|nr:hypothetical protein [Streptomyces nigrescens]WAU03760.1 hypothetical protein STRNI_001938 [Streptomyces nigrescens]
MIVLPDRNFAGQTLVTAITGADAQLLVRGQERPPPVRPVPPP